MGVSALLHSRAARVTLVMSAFYAVQGVVMPFLARWLEIERGLTGAEIGVVLSLTQLLRMFSGPMLAVWTEGFADRSTPLRAVALAALGMFAAFFLADDFLTLAVLGFFALTFLQALTPLCELALLRATKEGRLSYGVGRGIASCAFIIANIAGAALIARFGLGAVIVWILSGLVMVCVSAWHGLGPDPSPPGARSAQAQAKGALLLLRTPRFVLLILSAGLIQASHAFYYGFSTIIWRGQGVSAELVGVLWSVGVAVEVAFFWTLSRYERWVAPEAFILIGGLGGLLRWSLAAFAPLGGVLWLIQAMHVMSFAATHIGAMRLLVRDTPDEQAGLAQSLYAAVAAGTFMGLATLLSGVLYDQTGAGGYWAMAAMAAAGTICALLLLNLTRPRARA